MTDSKLNVVKTKIADIVNETFTKETPSTTTLYFLSKGVDYLEDRLENVNTCLRIFKRLVRDEDLESLNDILNTIEEKPDSLDSVYEQAIQLINELYENGGYNSPTGILLEHFDLNIEPLSILSGVTTDKVMRLRIIKNLEKKYSQGDYVFLRNVKQKLNRILGHKEKLVFDTFEKYDITENDVDLKDLKLETNLLIDKMFKEERDPVLFLYMRFGNNLHLPALPAYANNEETIEYTMAEIFHKSLKDKVSVATDKTILLDILKKLEN